MLGHPKPGPAMSAGRGRTRRLGTRQRRVRVAVDEHPVGLLALDRLPDAGHHPVGIGLAHVEAVARLGQAELVVEDLGELGVVVLPGVERDLLDLGGAEGCGEGRRLDELGPVIAFSTYQPFFIAKSTGTADVQLVADATAVNPKTNAIVTVPNSPVKTVNDLAGKKIAVTALNTASHILTVSVMKDHGVDTSKVQWVPIPLPNIAQALRQGQVDAAYLPEPWITQAAKLAGATPIIDIDTGASKDFPLTGYGTTAKWVQANPKTLAAFQRAMQKATRDSSDRSKIEPLMVKYAHVDADTAKLMPLPAYLSTLDARRLQRVPDLLLQMGIITAKIDAAPMIAPQANS